MGHVGHAYASLAAVDADMCGGEGEGPRAQGRTDGATIAASRGSKMGGVLQPLPANYRMETPIQTLCQSASAFDYKM